MKGFSRVYSSSNENQPTPSNSNQPNFQQLSNYFPQFDLKKTTRTNYKPNQNAFKANSNNPLLANIKTQLNVLKDQMNKLFRKQSQANGNENVKNNFSSTRATSQNKLNHKLISGPTINRQSLKFGKNAEQKRTSQTNKTIDTSNKLQEFTSCTLPKKYNQQAGTQSSRFQNFCPKDNVEQPKSRQDQNKNKYEFYSHFEQSKRQCDSLKRQNQFLRKALQQKNSEIIATNSELSKLKNQKWCIQRESLDLKNSLDESLKKINTLQTDNIKYQKSFKQIQLQKDHLLNDLNYAKIEINKLSSKNLQLLKELDRLFNKNEAMKKEIQKNSIQKAKDIQLEKQLKQKKDALKQKQQLVMKLSQEISFLRQDIHFMGDTRVVCDSLTQINAHLNEDIVLLNLKILNKKFQDSNFIN